MCPTPWDRRTNGFGFDGPRFRDRLRRLACMCPKFRDRLSQGFGPCRVSPARIKSLAWRLAGNVASKARQTILACVAFLASERATFHHIDEACLLELVQRACTRILAARNEFAERADCHHDAAIVHARVHAHELDEGHAR